MVWSSVAVVRSSAVVYASVLFFYVCRDQIWEENSDFRNSAVCVFATITHVCGPFNLVFAEVFKKKF